MSFRFKLVTRHQLANALIATTNANSKKSFTLATLRAHAAKVVVVIIARAIRAFNI